MRGDPRRRSALIAFFVLVATLAALLATAPAAPVAADANEAPASVAARSLTAGDQHTCAIRGTSVKCWGLNNTGQLGVGDTATRGDNGGEMGVALPAVNLGLGRTATALSAGQNHTCALLDNGAVKCWGGNSNGQLGLGDTANRGDGPNEMGDNLPAVNLGTGRTARAVTAGRQHTCAVLDNGTVKCWGINATGALGLGDTAARGDGPGEMGDALPAVNLGTGRTAVAVTAGQENSCALLDNATVKCWGWNAYGQLGQGDVAHRGDGPNEMGDNLPAVNLGTGRTAVAISTDFVHTCAVLDNGNLKCWGFNNMGQLGQGDTAHRGDGPNEMGNNLPAIALGAGRTATSVSASVRVTCARLDNSTVKCWGENNFGQLGLGDIAHRGDNPNEMGDNLPAANLGTGRTALAVVSGSNGHTCAQLDNNAIKCWGYNTIGQLGLGDIFTRGDGPGEMGDNLPAVSLTGRRAVSVSAGIGHACAILDNGTAKCWGRNDFGQLGLGDTVSRGAGPNEMGDNLPTVNLGTGRTAVAIAAGGQSTCALLDNATVKCWGRNDLGKLGLGDTANRGDGPDEMGDNLPTVNLGTGRSATAISVGSEFVCARLDNGLAKCWGSNGAGQLGLGDTNHRGDGPGEMGNNLPTVNLGTGRTATGVAVADANTTCARLDNGLVKCWGTNFSGSLGLGDETHRGDNAGEMGDNLPAVDLGTGRTATAVSTSGSASHSCARIDTGGLKCWGSNNSGQLGLGDTNHRGDVAGEMGNSLPVVNLGAGRRATVISLGFGFGCAVLDNGAVKCWGWGSSGQLGLGAAGNRGDQPNEMGDALPVVNLGSAQPSGMTGKVVDTVSGAPVPGAFVAILRSTDFSIAAGIVTDSAGNYSAELAAGTYYPYLIDATGAHTIGFSTPNTPRVVPVESFLTANLNMAPTRGRFVGVVTEDGTGNPVPEALVLALTNLGNPEAITVANSSGGYTLPDMRVGNHFLGFVDPTGGHVSEFYPNSPNVPAATLQPITAGGTTVASDSMAPQTPIGTGANLTGNITDTTSGLPLPGMVVVALRASDFKMARATRTNATGNYTLNVAAGAYKLAFIDGSGDHLMEWHNNQPNTGLGASTNVTAPATTNASLARTTGSMFGTVLDGTTSQPLAGAWVFAIGPTGITAGTTTATNGTYTLDGLTPGTYRVTFADPIGGRPQEYWDNALDFASAGTLNVTAGGVINDVDGALG